MMKTKLKFFLLLLAMMVGGLNSAWSQVADEIYDFEYWQQKSGATLNKTGSYSGITNGAYTSSITTTSDGTLNETRNGITFVNGVPLPKNYDYDRIQETISGDTR